MFRTITTGTYPVNLNVDIFSISTSQISLQYTSQDSYTSRLKVNYLVVNSNYINSSFQIFSYAVNNINITSSLSYTELSPTPIDTTGGYSAAAFIWNISLTNPPANSYSLRILVNINTTHITGYSLYSYLTAKTYINALNFYVIYFQNSAFQVSGETSAWIYKTDYSKTSSYNFSSYNLILSNRYIDVSTNFIIFFGVSALTFYQGDRDFSLSHLTINL